MSQVDVTAFTILVASFLAVTLIGFAAARWRPAEDPMHLNERGLGVAVAFVLTLVFRAARVPDGYDETRPAHYVVDPVNAPAATPSRAG